MEFSKLRFFLDEDRCISKLATSKELVVANLTEVLETGLYGAEKLEQASVHFAEDKNLSDNQQWCMEEIRKLSSQLADVIYELVGEEDE